MGDRINDDGKASYVLQEWDCRAHRMASIEMPPAVAAARNGENQQRMKPLFIFLCKYRKMKYTRNFFHSATSVYSISPRCEQFLLLALFVAAIFVAPIPSMYSICAMVLSVSQPSRTTILHLSWLYDFCSISSGRFYYYFASILYRFLIYYTSLEQNSFLINLENMLDYRPSIPDPVATSYSMPS